jgi:transposase
VIPTGLRIFFGTAPVDMRCSIDGLAAAVADRLKRDPSAERALFVFANTKRDRLKLLWHETSGWCVLYKRFEGFRVAVPAFSLGDTSITIDTRQLAQMFDGTRMRASEKEIVREARRKVLIK